jgi:hypothetical protein
MVVRDKAGYVYAAVPHERDHEILRFAPSGALTGTFGRYGPGPGEYRYVVSISLFSDSILVVAHDNRYITEFTLSGEPLNTRAVTPRVTGLGLKRPGGGFVMTGLLRRPGEPQHPVHFVSGEGQFEGSAGTDDVTSPNGRRARVMSPVEPDGFWISEEGIYRVERIDSLGRVTRVIGITAPASFYSATYMSREDAEAARSAARVRRDRTAELLAKPATSPVPPWLRITSVREHDGYLVIVGNAAAPAWAETELTYRPGGEASMDHASLLRLYETFVDVIDPASGELLARQRVPGYGSLVDDDVLVTLHADDLGVVTGQLHRISFRRPH